MTVRASPLVAAIAAGAAVAGCSLARTDVPVPISQEAWSDRPLPPSADLADRVLGPDSPCLVQDEGPQPLQLLVQDRRMRDGAAFFVTSPGHFCSAMFLTNGSSSSVGPALRPTNLPLKIDDRGGSSMDTTFFEELGGRISVPAAQVVVRFSDGHAVAASVANGYWLAWWPKSEALAVRVVALDAIGLEMAGVDVPAPGEPIEP